MEANITPLKVRVQAPRFGPWVPSGPVRYLLQHWRIGRFTQQLVDFRGRYRGIKIVSASIDLEGTQSVGSPVFTLVTTTKAVEMKAERIVQLGLDEEIIGMRHGDVTAFAGDTFSIMSPLDVGPCVWVNLDVVISDRD